MMFDFDDKEIQRLEKELHDVAEKAVPFATRYTLNTVAFKTRTFAQRNIEDNFVLRNEWTRGSIFVKQAKTLDIAKQKSSTGSGLEYLKKQEEGFTERRKGKYGVAIPTSWSAGQEGAKPRTKLPKDKYSLRAIQLSNRKRARNPGQRIAIAISQALKNKKRFVFLTMPDGRTHGIFRVFPSGSLRRKGKIKMVYDLSEPQVTGKPRPWLAPAVDDALDKLGGIYEAALYFQLDRRRLL